LIESPSIIVPALSSCLIHQTTAKLGAEVVLQCKGNSLLAYQTIALGKVVVFTLSALENDLEVRPYWSDPDWVRWSAPFLSAVLP
jgi:hypothetical protein